MRTSFSAFALPNLFRNLLQTIPNVEKVLSIKPELAGHE